MITCDIVSTITSLLYHHHHLGGCVTSSQIRSWDNYIENDNSLIDILIRSFGWSIKESRHRYLRYDATVLVYVGVNERFNVSNIPTNCILKIIIINIWISLFKISWFLLQEYFSGMKWIFFLCKFYFVSKVKTKALDNTFCRLMKLIVWNL